MVVEVGALEDDAKVVVAETEGIMEVGKVELVQATVVLEVETLEVVAVEEGMEDLETEAAEGGEQEDVTVTGPASCAAI